MEARLKYLNIFLVAFLFVFPTWVYWHEDGSVQRTPANFGSDSCRELIQRLSNVNLNSPARVMRPAFGFTDEAAAQGKHLQFGFESEYMLSELDGIVTVYGPKAEFGISEADWFNMPVAERSQWVRDHIKDLFPQSRTEGGLVRLKRDADMDFLPDSLIFDDTGNVEFVLDPFDTFEEWYHSIQKLNRTFGEGSQQATISTPPDSFFGRNIEGVDPSKVLDEKIGFFNYYSDYDILQKLSAAARRYEEDPTKRVTRNFEHPFLGPMTSKKQEILHSMLRGNAIGEKYEADRLQRIAGWENSFKYTGGTVYRPDILGERRVIMEVRDAHKNFPLLADRLLRSLYFMQHGTGGMDQLKGLKNFDPFADFEKFPIEVQEELTRLFPNKANPNYDYDPELKKALDVFRNFAYPMRDWSDHLEAFGKTEISDQVRQAQDAYKEKLRAIVGRLRAQEIDDSVASNEIQGALAEFSNSSGIAKAFADYEDEVVFGGNRGVAFNQFVREATIEAGALASSFPEKIWSGPLKERVTLLQQKFPQMMKKMEGVSFSYNNSSGGSRDIFVVSLKDLSQQQKEAFFKEYYEAVSENTVSFPLSSGAGHLYTRLGNKTYDFLSGLSARAYPLPSSKRLETFMELEPDEFMRLRLYVENGTENSQKTIGGFGYQGVERETVGMLNDNRPGSVNPNPPNRFQQIINRVLNRGDGTYTPTGEAHNCTSWLCTAPIGDNGEAIHDLAGAPRSHRIHTNPGWWTSWLVNYGKRDRMPFAFYFTDEGLEEATSSIGQAGKLDWNFDTH